MKIESHSLVRLNDSEKEVLSKELYDFSKTNTSEITQAYLLKRLSSYGHLTLVKVEDRIVGFGFADFRKIKRRFPLIHFGLMIIDKDWRKKRISLKICKNIVKAATEASGPFCFLTGFAVSAKCSSPVSFYRLQQGTFRIGFPRITSQGELSGVTRSVVGKKISMAVAEALQLGQIEDYLLRNANDDSGFRLSTETYRTNSRYEAGVLRYFESRVMPLSELLFVSYTHPILTSFI
jgi:hypothetical protein